MTNYGTLKLILYYCELIIDIHKSHDSDQVAFTNDCEYQYAISMGLIQIGELANKLTNDFKDYFSNLPWSHMRSFRNRLAHQYGSIDIDLTYWISTVDITRIHGQLLKIITDFEQEFPKVINMEEKND
ncbi:MAG: HepT-like ribonuclease domain-containing protein [Erysipelotrichaceae bacterium]|nr:HepT-like ribonuclease domain-containing protein [Erysipelotrichaceae bacterium]